MYYNLASNKIWRFIYRGECAYEWVVKCGKVVKLLYLVARCDKKTNLNNIRIGLGHL
jgi:hypothetical protein